MQKDSRIRFKFEQPFYLDTTGPHTVIPDEEELKEDGWVECIPVAGLPEREGGEYYIRMPGGNTDRMAFVFGKWWRNKYAARLYDERSICFSTKEYAALKSTVKLLGRRALAPYMYDRFNRYEHQQYVREMLIGVRLYVRKRL